MNKLIKIEAISGAIYYIGTQYIRYIIKDYKSDNYLIEYGAICSLKINEKELKKILSIMLIK